MTSRDEKQRIKAEVSAWLHRKKGPAPTPADESRAARAKAEKADRDARIDAALARAERGPDPNHKLEKPFVVTLAHPERTAGAPSTRGTSSAFACRDPKHRHCDYCRCLLIVFFDEPARPRRIACARCMGKGKYPYAAEAASVPRRE